MPGTWNVDDFTEGGLASVEEFIGRLDNVEEDVEGKFGLQLELSFSEVEIIEAGDDVTLDEGRYTSWIKQTNKKNSTNGKMFVEWAEFASAHDLGDTLPDCFYGMLMRWRRSTYEFGDDMTPGRAMIPVELIEEGGSKTKKTKSKVVKARVPKAAPPPAKEPEDEDGEESNLPEELVNTIHGVVGEEGATRDMIRRALAKKAALRKLLADAGGLDVVLPAMEDTLDEDDGTYTRVESDDDPV